LPKLHEFDAIYGTIVAVFKYEAYFAIGWPLAARRRSGEEIDHVCQHHV
jgi:hypothetical protein